MFVRSVDRAMTCMASLGAGIAAAALALEASGQAIEAPRWQVGDRWQFAHTGRFKEDTTSWSREVVRAEPDGTFCVKVAKGRNAVFDGLGNSLDRRGADFSWKRFDFPMFPGKTWSYERTIEGKGWQGIEQGLDPFEVHRGHDDGWLHG